MQYCVHYSPLYYIVPYCAALCTVVLRCDQIFDGNLDAVSVRKHYLDRPQVARYVQLWPVDYNRGMAVRWELYGCPGTHSLSRSCQRFHYHIHSHRELFRTYF